MAILAHYYVDGEVQKIADYVGDSFYLSKVATTLTQNNILFCGVKFMGESAKLLNPEKRVVMADDFADCPMAHMVTVEKIQEVRKQYDDLAVVCYVNSTAEIKAVSDVCVTSSNALRVVEIIPEKNPKKKFYSVGHRQFCPNMKKVTLDKVEEALNHMSPEIELPEDLIEAAKKPLGRMLELS